MRSLLIGLVLASAATAILLVVGAAIRVDIADFEASLKGDLGPLDPAWRDAAIIKICHGSTIYRLRDGRIVAQGGYRVENPETVCEVP